MVMFILFLYLFAMCRTRDGCDFEQDKEAVDELTCPWMGMGGVGGLEDPSYCSLAKLL